MAKSATYLPTSIPSCLYLLHLSRVSRAPCVHIARSLHACRDIYCSALQHLQRTAGLPTLTSINLQRASRAPYLHVSLHLRLAFRHSRHHATTSLRLHRVSNFQRSILLCIHIHTLVARLKRSILPYLHSFASAAYVQSSKLPYLHTFTSLHLQCAIQISVPLCRYEYTYNMP